MLFSEKDLEDYICNNQEQFINELKNIYGEDENIKFIGRQVRIGENNIADLIYYFDNKSEDVPFVDRNFIIVELKFRELEPKDLAQLSRYMTILNEKLNSEDISHYEHTIYGVFVSFGQNELMQDISCNLTNEHINFVSIKNNLSFKEEIWHYKENYIDNLKLDKRIINLYGIENE